MRFLLNVAVPHELSLVVPIQQPTQTSKKRPFFTTRAPGTRCGSIDAVSQTTKRQRLQEHLPRSGQRCQKEPFAAEQRVLDTACELNVIVDAWLESHETACV